MVLMSLILAWNGQFCGDVIGHQNMRVAVNGQFLFCCYFLSVLFVKVSQFRLRSMYRWFRGSCSEFVYQLPNICCCW